MRVKSNVKAGGGLFLPNHNQTTAGVRVKSKVKAGGRSVNHSQAVARSSR